MNRAYAVLHVKAVDPVARTISGIAATPTPDRHGDIFEPLGATFHNPIPLLLYHDGERPVGQATLEATAGGILFEAQLATIETPGAVRDRVEEAWTSVVANLVRGASIGFRPLKNGMKVLKDGGLHFLKTEIVELSLVTIPANVDATVLAVKQFDAPHLAALGPDSAGVAALPVVRADKAAPRMAKQTTAERIKDFETTRAAKVARMTAIMDAAEGVTLDATQTEEYDGLDAEVKSIDAHLVRMRALEKTEMAAAKPVVEPPVKPPDVRTPIITVKANVPPGTAFTRAAIALLVSKGNRLEAIEYAKRWDDQTPEVGLYLKAAVAAGNTTDATWAGPLVQPVNIANEFLELLRPATILGKIPGLRRVPFNAQVPAQTAGGTYGWVGEAKPKPVTKLALTTVRLEISKAAGIIVLTEELVRTSTPSAEAITRADMIAGIAAFLDTQFIDPAVAYVANVHPASITNGTTPIASSGNALEDIQALLGALSTANIPLAGVTLIMSETNALHLSFLRDAMGNPVFPNVGVNGGTVQGITIITSNAAGTNIIALQPSTVLYADEGGVTIDVSREASVEMSDTPMSPVDATTVLVSLWQNNLVGLRAERFINWKRGRDTGVKYVSGADFAPAGVMATRNGTPRSEAPRSEVRAATKADR